MDIVKTIKSNFFKIISYGLFGLLCFFTFFFIRFPFDLLVKNTISALEREYNLDISVKESGYSFPSGIKLTGLDIRDYEGKSFSYEIEKLKIKYPLSSIFFIREGFDFDATAFDGEIYGSIEFDEDTIFLDIKTSEDINLQKTFPEVTKKGFSLAGMAKINLEGDVSEEDIKTFNGSGRVEISKGTINNISPLLPVIPVEKAIFEFESSRGRNSFKKIDIKGEGVAIKGQGNLDIRKKIEDTSIKLKLFGEYDPSTETGKAISLLGLKGKKNIPIELSGPLLKPTLKIEGKSFWNMRSRQRKRR